MFSTVCSFEIRQQLGKPFTWVFLLLMILQGAFYMHHAGEFYSADKTYANAPAILYTVLAGIGYIGFIVTAILGGTALGKDVDHRTTSLLYTTRTSELSFFYGRYIGSVVVLLLLFSGYLAGIYLYNYLPVPNLGPFSWAALIRAIVIIFLPNVFILYSLCVATSVLTRSSKSGYAAALTGMLLMIFAETTFDSNVNVVLADPTGFSVLHHQLQHLSPLEKNNFSPPFSGLLLYNRLIWISLSSILLLIAAKKFTFMRFSAARISSSKNKNQDATEPVGLPASRVTDSIKISQQFGLPVMIRKIFSLSFNAFLTVVRPIGFRLFLSLILVIYICYIAVWQQQYYSAAPTLPLTLQITGVTLPLSFYFLLFLIINTTELLFRNQTTGFWQISDALPVPSWVDVLSKILAMLGVAVLMTCCLLLFGLLVQTAKSYHHYEFGVYFSELFIRWVPKYFAYILLTVFIAGLTANRYATHWICILILVTSTVLNELEIIEQNRLNFVFSPGSGKTTDMNGSSIFAAAHGWYMLYWVSLGIAMLSLGLWVWRRGTASSLLQRFKHNKLQPGLLLMLVAGIAGFLFCGNKIYRTVNVENRFQTKEEIHAESALYEKEYKRYQNYPQPVLENLTLNIDLYPAERQLAYSANLDMKNRSNQPIDTLHVEWMDFSSLDALTLFGYHLSIVKQDTALRHTIYKLDHPISPRQNVQCHVSGRLGYKGFTNGDPQKELTFNGSFLSNSILPYFGYDDRRELRSNQYRTPNGLQKIAARLPGINDTIASKQLFASKQAGRLNYSLTISTGSNQQIIASGLLNRHWQKGGRNYYQYVTEKPGLFDFHILSGTYNVKKEQYNIAGHTISIEAYYHPGHPYNVDRFISSAREALTDLTTTLGTYPYQVLRIVERPHYDEDLFAYDNVIVLPENHGWTADIRKQEDLDYLRYVTTKLIAEQFMQQANVSRTQGYPLITRSIPGYLALLQLQKFYGKASLQHRLEKNYDTYLKGRAQEANQEPTLMKVDDKAIYVSENKGSVVLYKLSQKVGEAKVNRAVASFLLEAERSQTPVNASLFYQKLQLAVGPEYSAYLHQAFETNSDLNLERP